MKNILRKIFLNDKVIMAFILLNAIIIYMQVSGYENTTLDIVDAACTIIFIIEMIVKHHEYGVRGYWSNGWNRMDGVLVILSIPSLINVFIPTMASSLSVLLILRVLRVLRFFRVMHFFPNFAKVVTGFKVAMRQSYGVLLSFFVIIVVFGLLNCSLFQNADSEHFSTPLRSIYSVFQICTVEGWYDIPNAVAEYYGESTILPHLIRVYFTFLLIMGGIIGMSFINSIFVDAMVADSNDDIEKQLKALQNSVDNLKQLLEEKSK